MVGEGSFSSPTPSAASPTSPAPSSEPEAGAWREGMQGRWMWGWLEAWVDKRVVGQHGTSSLKSSERYNVKTGETLTVSSREEFRNWLARYHKTKKEIWLVYYYKLTGRQTVSYGESVEEAICYGWIDSQQNRVDDKRFVRRFSPRRRGSHWSKYNKVRALKMLREGKMKQSGMAVLPGDVLEAWKQREGTKSSSVGA